MRSIFPEAPIITIETKNNEKELFYQSRIKELDE